MKLTHTRSIEFAAGGEGDPAFASLPASTLDAAPLFDGLETAEVGQILASFDQQHFNAGHRVTLEGFRGREFYLIAEGTAEVTNEGRYVAGLGPGDFFGEVAVLSDGLRSATVTATTPLSCLVLSDDALERLLVEHPRLSVNMLREVATRFSAASATSRGPQQVVG